MIRTGKVVGSEIKANKDGDTDVRILSVQLTDTDDVQTVEYYDDGGRDYRPPDGAEVVILDVSSSHRIAVAVDDLLEPVVSKGEMELYSTDTAGTAKAATVYLKNDGAIEILDSTDFAVRYSELQAAFDELKADFNSLVSAFNAHEHLVPSGTDIPGGTTTARVPPADAASSSADITGAKIDEIKVPA